MRELLKTENTFLKNRALKMHVFCKGCCFTTNLSRISSMYKLFISYAVESGHIKMVPLVNACEILENYPRFSDRITCNRTQTSCNPHEVLHAMPQRKLSINDL